MKFLRNLLAVLVGLFLFSIISFFILAGIFSSLASMEDQVNITDNSVLELDLNRQILERVVDDPLADAGFLPGVKGALGLIDLLEMLKYAKNDENIKGIYLESSNVMAGYASLKEIRDALLDFKSSGKFIIAYSQLYTEKGYYLASVADTVMLNPSSTLMEFNGISYSSVFFKGTLEKLGVEPVIFRVGEFKSAIEPFTRKDMSEENRMQINSFINSIYNDVLRDISDSRNVPVEKLEQVSDSMLVWDAEDALREGLIDQLGYYDQLVENIRQKMGLEDEKEVQFVSVDKYLKAVDIENTSRNRIAVIVANGEIMTGKGDNTTVGSETFVETLRRVRKDKNIKAVVLRINSPGGDGLASDVIWREIELTKSEKPVIASMSDMATSGGYYIAMGADTIVAEPTTVTGSIGVFGMFFNVQDFLNDKLGITTDVVNTGLYSDIFDMSQPLSPYEKEKIQRRVESFYTTFITKAAQGRNMPVEKMDEIAQGRVWTGLQAQEIGLIDVIGGFDQAIQIAVNKAGLEADDYRLRYYPRQKTFLEELMTEFGGSVEARIQQQRLGEYYIYYKQLKALKNRTGIQTRLPFDLILN